MVETHEYRLRARHCTKKKKLKDSLVAAVDDTHIYIYIYMIYITKKSYIYIVYIYVIYI
jgi:hypothetical protein